MALTQNEYGFDLKVDNPFLIFRVLAKVAQEKVGVDKVLDLSRGDPGYGFAPNSRSRKFYSFLVALDTHFNNFDTHFKDRTVSEEAELLKQIDTFANETYKPTVANELMKDFTEFCAGVIEAAHRQELEWNHFDVLFHLFKYATVSGGCYHDPYGELISRIVVADYHSQSLQTSVKYSDLVLTHGASDAIGTFFKAFGEEGGKWLVKGDTVLITSPVYFPYMNILKSRGLNILTVSANPENGQFDEDAFEKLEGAKPKLIVLVDPDNPTGFTKSEASLKLLADYAKKVDAMILSDEVYHSFHPGKKSVLNFARNRTIRIDARSKIERATGCRFGEFIVVDEANTYLTKMLKGFIPESATDLRHYLYIAKGPGSAFGEFQHTTFVPGPGQILSLCHIILGEKERAKYVDLLKQNMETWYKGLGLEWKGNFYYSQFDMNAIATDAKKKIPAERKFLDLAERGVVLIPANLFFSVEDREAADRRNYARGSLPNLTNSQVAEAAKIIREYLQS